jgi:hypothetical protein
MYFKKILQTLLLTSILLLISGCIRDVGLNGLTMNIDNEQLNKPSNKFPIKRDFVVANLEIKQPNIFIKDGENRISAKLDINISAIFIPKTAGKFEISGVPYFNKENASIYLNDVTIENIDFTDAKIDTRILSTLTSNIKPVINSMFKQIPIYKIKEDSFKGSFVKDVKIENSELLVTFGL